MTATNPDVPETKGVPPVFRDGSNPAVDPNQEPMTADGAITVVGAGGWGIYTSAGTKALDPDSVFTVEPNREFRISDYPQEAGGFQSYNKVATPAEIRITVTKGGSKTDRLTFLRDVERLLETLDLYSVVTPDATYSSVNFIRRDYRRTAESGASLLTIDLVAMEVRETVESSYTNTKKPSGADPVNAGPVQPETISNAALKDKVTAIDASKLPTVTPLPTVTKAASTIPTLAKAAQVLTTVIGDQRIAVSLRERAFGLFADVVVNGSPVVSGVPAQNLNTLIKGAYVGFSGNLLFYDKMGDSAPNFAGLGDRFALIYRGP